MNRKYFEQKIVEAYTHSDTQNLNQVYVDLVNMRSKLDRWFNKYLDMFNERLEECESNDPVKRLYSAKYEQYQDILRVMKTAEYYINKAKISYV